MDLKGDTMDNILSILKTDLLGSKIPKNFCKKISKWLEQLSNLQVSSVKWEGLHLPPAAD
jgi:hypothetical protein